MSAISPSFESPLSLVQPVEPKQRPELKIVKDEPAAAPADDQRSKDQALVRAILDGEPGSFEELHSLYADRLYRFAVSRLRDPVEAEDVVQDTLLEVHKSLASWEGRSRLLTWMFGIAHHQLCRRFRKKTPIGVPIEELDAVALVAPAVSGEQRLDAIRALEVCADVLEDDLSSSQREIFDLYYGENLSMKEIAANLGKSSQAVKISLFRSRRAMREEVEALDAQMSA